MFFYNILIRPIQYLIEVAYVLLYHFLQDPSLAVIGLSLVVSTLVLPLYVRAETIQEQERKQQHQMKYWNDHIRRTFHGDERYMMQNTYYKEQGYHPWYAFKGTLSLLLQVPFFLAAYQFLSHLELLQGCSFGIFKDLGVEDNLLLICGVRINLLPIMMTIINMCSSFIYTKGLSLKDKLQPYILAIIFFALLYHSPSGLVLYWTVNNLYSLGKNILMRRPLWRKSFKCAASILLTLLFLYFMWIRGWATKVITERKYEDGFIYLCIFCILMIPVIENIINMLMRKMK